MRRLQKQMVRHLPLRRSATQFTQALEAERRLTSRLFHRIDVIAFVEASWPLMLDRPNVGSWVEAFGQAQRGKFQRAICRPVWVATIPTARGTRS